MNIVTGGSLAGYGSFSRPASRRTTSLLQERSRDFRSRITSDRLMGLLSDFDTSSRRMNITEMLDEIRIAKRRENNYFDDGHVRYLEDIVDIQHGNPTMRRLIMADLDIQRMSRDNQIEGWANNYKDPDRGKSGWQHRDYRRLNKGLYKKREDGSTVSSYYYEDQGADELALTEKLDALRTIDLVKRMIRQGGEDPTSLNGGHLT